MLVIATLQHMLKGSLARIITISARIIHLLARIILRESSNTPARIIHCANHLVPHLLCHKEK